MILPIVSLSLLTWVTYWGAIRNGFVSDDIEGIANYDGKFLGWDYGRITKWLWQKLFQKNAAAHHTFSILLHNINVCLLYVLLSNLFSPRLALFASILYTVHSVNTQSVAWISARGYPLGLMWTLIIMNMLTHYATLLAFPFLNPILYCVVIAVFILFYYFSIHAQFATMVGFVLFGFMGYPLVTMIGCLMSLVMGFGIVKEVIGIRAKVFKEQNMGESTQLSPKRLIIAFKTLYYYTRLCLFPKRMGLYHVYGYHYTPELVKIDKLFFKGLGVATVLLLGLVFGNPVIQFGILWYLAYIFIFLNWITIHQFLSERYCYIANVGLCIVLAYILLPFPIVFAFIVGLYLMRTWTHLPTYEDEVPFYQSNVWNFPNSEVAFANLGVTYMKRGLVNSAMDMWLIALKINPQYDVSHYNISSTLKTRGQLTDAHKHLKSAVESPECHFKDLWAKELTQLEHEMQYVEKVNKLREAVKTLDNEKSKEISKQLEELQALYTQSESFRKNQLEVYTGKRNEVHKTMIELNTTVANLSKPINPFDIIVPRDQKLSELEKAMEQLKNENPKP